MGTPPRCPVPALGSGGTKTGDYGPTNVPLAASEHESALCTIPDLSFLSDNFRAEVLRPLSAAFANACATLGLVDQVPIMELAAQ